MYHLVYGQGQSLQYIIEAIVPIKRLCHLGDTSGGITVVWRSVLWLCVTPPCPKAGPIRSILLRISLKDGIDFDKCVSSECRCITLEPSKTPSQ